MKRLFAIFSALVMISTSVLAGQPYTAAKGSKISVAGTSTMHDWTMVSEEVQVQASMPSAGQFETLKLTVPVSTLKSGKSGMDDNAYKALKSKQYPQINFVLNNTKPAAGASVEATGLLTIAGVTKEIKTTGKVETLSSGDVKITGSYKFNMSEYKVEPPSFMFGTVNTGDEVTITYELILSK